MTASGRPAGTSSAMSCPRRGRSWICWKASTAPRSRCATAGSSGVSDTPGAQMISDDLRQRRLAVIQEHMDTEVTQDFDQTLATFNGHPRYEIMATGQVFDGDSEVMGYHRTTSTAFPDQPPDDSRFHIEQ